MKFFFSLNFVYSEVQSSFHRRSLEDLFPGKLFPAFMQILQTL